MASFPAQLRSPPGAVGRRLGHLGLVARVFDRTGQLGIALGHLLVLIRAVVRLRQAAVGLTLEFHQFAVVLQGCLGGARAGVGVFGCHGKFCEAVDSDLPLFMIDTLPAPCQGLWPSVAVSARDIGAPIWLHHTADPLP